MKSLTYGLSALHLMVKSGIHSRRFE